MITKTHQIVHVRVTFAVHQWINDESDRRETSVCTLVRQAIGDAIEAATGKPILPIKATEAYSNAPRKATGLIALALPLVWADQIRELAAVDEMPGSHWTGAAVERFMAKVTGAEVPTIGQKAKMTPAERLEKQRAWKKKYDDKRRGIEAPAVGRRQTRNEIGWERHAAFVAMSKAGSRWPTGTNPAMWGGA